MVLPRRWQRSLFILFSCGRNGGYFFLVHLEVEVDGLVPLFEFCSVGGYFYVDAALGHGRCDGIILMMVKSFEIDSHE